MDSGSANRTRESVQGRNDDASQNLTSTLLSQSSTYSILIQQQSTSHPKHSLSFTSHQAHHNHVPRPHSQPPRTHPALARQAPSVDKYPHPPVPKASSHTYLLASAQVKFWVGYSGSAALHSADRSWIESPSGASAGQFLLAFLTRRVWTFSLMLSRYCGWVEEEVSIWLRVSSLCAPSCHLVVRE